MNKNQLRDHKIHGMGLVKAVGAACLLCCLTPVFAAPGPATGGKASEATQQTQTVEGLVTDNQGQALIGVSVVVQGTQNGTVTDFNGRFSLKAKVGDILEFTYMGFITQVVTIDGNPINLVMEEDTQRLDEVVVVGYGSSTRRDLIASVSTVKADQMANIPVANIAQGLAGRSPGMIVRASGGGINSRPSLSIRGGGDPLYVIDGIIRSGVDFQNLSPEDIESMSILKDASATAVYGSRASNGIIQVTTKKGKAGRARVEYDFNTSIAQPALWPEKMNAWERAEYSNIAKTNDGLTPTFSDDAIRKMKDGSDPMNFSNTDWRKLVLNDWAPQSKHTVRVTGGNDKTSYYASLGHINQNSLYKSDNNWMKRTNFRLAQSTTIEQIGLQINTTLDGYRQKYTHPNTSSASDYGTVFSHINNKSPLIPGVNKYGLPYAIADNPVAETAADAGYAKSFVNVINGKGELVWTLPWLKELKVRAASNYRYYGETSKNWRKDAGKYYWDTDVPTYDNVPQLSHTAATGYSFTNQAFLDYANKLGKHSISALAGFEQYYESYETYSLSRKNYPFPIDQISIGDTNTQENSGDEGELGRAAFIGQIKYNYASKYYVEGGLRYDGSDRFAPGKRWGAFFSGSAGWVVTQEPFMQDLVSRNILNTLKLRASYGETGLDASAGRFQYMTTYNYDGRAYVIKDQYVPGFTEGALPSPDLTWYTTRQTDLGLDFASLGDRLYGSFDYFYYSTKGYLVAPTGESYVNTALGVSLPRVKSDSESRRAGIEIQLGWRNSRGAFTYDISGNFTWYNTVWALDESEAESSRMNPYTRSQQVLQNYYGSMYNCLGFYQDADDVFNSPGFVSAYNSGNLTAGDLKYQDVNGDGKLDGNDGRRMGRPSAPRGQYGLNINLGYKGFYLSALFLGSTAFDMYSDGNLSMQTGQMGDLPIAFEYQTDFWTQSNRNAQYPRLMSSTSLNSNNNFNSSNFWLYNGTYLRLKDFQFGYDFKHVMLKGVNWLSRCRLGISGQNLFTISKAAKYGMDPETGSTANYAYPVERILAFSLNLGF